MIVVHVKIIKEQTLVKLVALNLNAHLIQFCKHQDFVAHVETTRLLLMIGIIVSRPNAPLIQD
jgi:hypothetical protein